MCLFFALVAPFHGLGVPRVRVNAALSPVYITIRRGWRSGLVHKTLSNNPLAVTFFGSGGHIHPYILPVQTDVHTMTGALVFT